MVIKKTCISTIAIIICIFLYPVPAHAQEQRPLWWQNLDCNREEQRFSGIEYCTGKSPYEYIYVIVIQLESPGVQIDYLLPNGINRDGNEGECRDVNRTAKGTGPGCDDPENGNWYPVMSLEQAVNQAQEQPNVAVVINGDYSACTNGPSQGCPLSRKGELIYREHGPEGLTVVRGNRLDGPNYGDGDNNLVRRPYLVISQSTPLRAELHKSNSDNGLKPYNWIYTGVGGAPWLIQNGELSTHSIATCENAAGSCYEGASQTAVGLTLDKKWMFLVLAVKADTLEDVATFMKDQLGAWQAMKFDGGGSSQLFYTGVTDPYIETGDGRPLTNFLAVYAQPGTGIFSDSPLDSPDPTETPEPPVDGSDLNWWQQIQRNWTDFWNTAGDWWQDQRQKAEDWWNGIETWWQELPQRIEDWLLQQFMDWLNQRLNQLCGSAGLIPVTMAIVIYTRRRYHRP